MIAAEGEHKASRALRHAAEVIADSPAALQVRLISTERNTQTNRQRHTDTQTHKQTNRHKTHYRGYFQCRLTSGTSGSVFDGMQTETDTET